jgi:tetratricopeptide (TPR) repeat protein
VKPGGEPGERAALEASLERGRAGRRVLLEQNIAEALKASPNDAALLRMKDNLRRGEEYLKRIAEMYSDDEKVLVSAAQRMRSVCQYEGKGPVESYDQIAAIYEQALEVNPGNVAALADLGGLAAVAGKDAEAREYLDRALELDPTNVEALVRAGDVLTAAEDYSRAVGYFKRAVALAPDRLDIHNSLAAALTSVGSVDEAIRHLKRAIELSGDSQPELHYNLGQAYGAKGDMENAAASFRTALAANPSSVKYRLWLAVTLLEKGETVEAKAEFEKVLAVEPENVDARTRVGIILLGEGRLDEAIAEFRKVLATSPGYPQAIENMAKALVKKRAFAEAAGALREGMKLQPTNEIALSLAWLLATCPAAEVRNGREAIGLAETLDRITNNSSAEATDTLAAAYAESGFYLTAAKAAERALTRANALGNADLAAAIQKRLDLYRAGRAYHEE